MLRENVKAVESANLDELFALPSTADAKSLDDLRNHFAAIVCRDVSAHQLIDRERFPDCHPKPSSSFPGCIFAGTNKAGRAKKVYVKQYAKENIAGEKLAGKFDALMDYAVFQLLKCGRARAPKVRICASQQESGKFNHYLFATDIAHARSKHQDKIYYFSDLGDNGKVRYLEQNGMLSSRVDLIPDPQPPEEEEFKRLGFIYNIDFSSTARLLMLGMILQLADLHADNVGFVLSRKGREVKAKLTFIDFITMPRELPIGEHTASLKYMLHNHYHVRGAAEALVKLVEKIPEEAFVAAFNEIIEAGIANRCDAFKFEIRAMDFVSESMQAKFVKRMQIIETNIDKLQNFINDKYQRKSSKKCVIC